MRVNIIAAVAKDNFAIGKENGLLWHISEDLKRFRKLTLKKPIIMGRKTYESIGRPLPERINIVLTRKKNWQIPGCIIKNSLEEALGFCERVGYAEVFIIGGAKVYEQALRLADRLYITWVKGAYEADTFFPEVDWRAWEKISEIERKGYTFVVYKRRRSQKDL